MFSLISYYTYGINDNNAEEATFYNFLRHKNNPLVRVKKTDPRNNFLYHGQDEGSSGRNFWTTRTPLDSLFM